MSASILVHLRINDAETGKPTPVRLHISGPDGRFYAPLGRVTDFPIGRNEVVGGHVLIDGRRYVYIDGSCEIELPTQVPLQLEIHKGPLYRPVKETISLGKGQMALRYNLERWLSPADWNWQSADSRCHFLDVHTALLEGQAEGLQIVNLLAIEQDYPSIDGQLYRTIPQITAFSGMQPALSHPACDVVVNTFNIHAVLGQLGLVNCHRVIFPLRFGPPDGTDDWSLADWCDQCHRKMGLVVWANPFATRKDRFVGEGLIDVILGKVDAIELDSQTVQMPLLQLWYSLLNTGFQIPIVGGSAKSSNQAILGSLRTWTPVSTLQTNRYGNWIEQVRQGKTVVSNGPLLQLEVNSQSLGETVRVAQEQSSIGISADVWSQSTDGELQILHNGSIIHRSGLKETKTQVHLEIPLSKGGWLAARVISAASGSTTDRLFAHTSPIYLQVQQIPSWDGASIPSLLESVQMVQEWIETTGQFSSERRKQQLQELCEKANRELHEREKTA